VSARWQTGAGEEPGQHPQADPCVVRTGAHRARTDLEPTSSSAAAPSPWPELLPRRSALRERIRALAPTLGTREAALFGFVWLQMDLLDDVRADAAHWTLSALEALVRAFETAEAPAATEPP
jgi:hypothetical protein